MKTPDSNELLWYPFYTALAAHDYTLAESFLDRKLDVNHRPGKPVPHQFQPIQCCEFNDPPSLLNVHRDTMEDQPCSSVP